MQCFSTNQDSFFKCVYINQFLLNDLKTSQQILVQMPVKMLCQSEIALHFRVISRQTFAVMVIIQTHAFDNMFAANYSRIKPLICAATLWGGAHMQQAHCAYFPHMSDKLTVRYLWQHDMMC